MICKGIKYPTHQLQTISNDYCFCLFWAHRPTRDFFFTYGDATITGEWLQILTYALLQRTLKNYAL